MIGIEHAQKAAYRCRDKHGVEVATERLRLALSRAGAAKLTDLDGNTPALVSLVATMRAPLSTWTPERETRVRDMWSAGYTASHIAERVGMTRGSILGRLNRLGLVGKGPPRGKVSAPAVRAPAARAKAVKPQPVPQPAGNPPIPFSALDYAFRQCRWEVGREDTGQRERLYCGDPVTLGSSLSFCPWHTFRAKPQVSANA